MLELPVGHGAPTRLADVLAAPGLGRRIVTERHCFGCTVGAGSTSAGSVAS